MAPSKTVAQITVGQPLVLPKCKKSENDEEKASCWSFYESDTDKSQKNPPKDTSLKVKFNDGILPVGIYNIAEIVLINGNVESIDLHTLGAVFQDDLFNMLTSKWGSPSRTNSQSLQNGFGATFRSVEAEWWFDDLTVAFLGMTSSDSGAIIIRSNVYTTRSQAEIQKNSRSL